MTGPSRRIVIIGGGLSGLSAAFYIRKFYKKAGMKPDIVLLEKEKTLGGKIETLHRDGFVIEKGPDSFLASKTEMIELAKELELDHELVNTNPKAEKTYILQRDKLHPMPTGLVLGIPTELKPFLSSALVSFGGKIRALMDLILPPKRSNVDESLGQLIERRLGTEVMENLTEPLLAGMYAGDLHKVSLQATFPQFGEVERQYGGLIRGFIKERNSSKTKTSTKNSTFLTFRKGLQSLVHGLIHELHDVEQRTEAAVVSIHATETKASRYELELESGERLLADEIYITTPNSFAAELLRPHVDVSALDAVNYVSVANLVLAFNKKDIEIDDAGAGFLVPRKEGRNITACTWTSTNWPHTSPEDKVLMRCHVGRSGDEQNVQLPDEALTELVSKDLREILGITAKPIFTEITRSEHSMPQYPVGHLDNLSKFHRELETTLPGIYVFGAGYDGVAMPDCVKQAKLTAQSAAKRISN
ncbi:oxygen-dependent protoporphyrinogen oxidase [Paenibacillus sp. PastF-3]|uniref:protoporphyrinogen oxidase n=1 Tax=Paenibacillus sp. PastF-3 TaxID=2940626 RepID=UPI00247574BC|nr:protoporphyrinogen oxidase [Paenibacillus sp. PastF-3]MDH6370360.1 oxygen-dependent protoporphyrinogen oxidase [Paenibacillus sp. PastF-3]